MTLQIVRSVEATAARGTDKMAASLVNDASMAYQVRTFGKRLAAQITPDHLEHNR